MIRDDYAREHSYWTALVTEGNDRDAEQAASEAYDDWFEAVGEMDDPEDILDAMDALTDGRYDDAPF